MKALLHITPRPTAGAAFGDAIATAAAAIRRSPAADAVLVTALLRVSNDPLGAKTPFGATIEIAGEAADLATFDALLADTGKRLEAVAIVADSALLIGDDVVSMESEGAPVRYQYLMRRRPDYDHAAYLKRYREVHYEFGLRTPGIAGYAQFHVDLVASRAAAEKFGFGVWDFDSVSQLHLESLEKFFAAVSESQVPREAMADEERFVDRANSFDFISHVEIRGDAVGISP